MTSVAYAFLNSQNNSLVSNALLSMANTDLNDIFCDEQDNLKHIYVINLHNMWNKKNYNMCYMLSTALLKGSYHRSNNR